MSTVISSLSCYNMFFIMGRIRATRKCDALVLWSLPLFCVSFLFIGFFPFCCTLFYLFIDSTCEEGCPSSAHVLTLLQITCLLDVANNKL